MMKSFVYGAGIIGNYLAHVLCAAGYDASILAHGRREGGPGKNGLVIRYYIQRRATYDHP